MGTVKTKGGSMNKITSTKDMQIDYAKVVVYGPPGAGKTTFGATFPDTLILSAESGLLSVRDQDIDVWEVGTWEDIEEAFRYLHTEKHNYKTVVLDSSAKSKRNSMNTSSGSSQPKSATTKTS